eukprot:CAMPEP_0182458972 /NCGR_PEP_ID=MMETSP1319-20130603/4195_1 /TAXON_ID=172717 /ORGANISM="Bolidomonas pacifica, Strain RCC208" /LENGTH=45 /DNA_ID= /DNA_START= /DNA_END= /DNA_ORIENTATION=
MAPVARLRVLFLDRLQEVLRFGVARAPVHDPDEGALLDDVGGFVS